MKKLILNKSRLTGAFYKLASEFNNFYSHECDRDVLQYYTTQAMKHPSDILLFNDTYKDMFNNELSDTYKNAISRMFDELFNGIIDVSQNYKIVINESILIDVFENMVYETNEAYKTFNDECEIDYNLIVTICYVHNIFTFDDTFDQLSWNILTVDIRKLLCETVDRMFKGIIELIETSFYEEEDTTK